MNITGIVACTTVTTLLVLAGCAASPLDEQRRKDMEADVDDILTYEHDPAEVGEIRNCLSQNEVRRYRALGNRHLLFEGRRNSLWVNVLRGRCPGLNDNVVFVMQSNVGGHFCDKDRFEVMDRFDSPAMASASSTCVLGEFKPVTEAQVKEIEKRLEMR